MKNRDPKSVSDTPLAQLQEECVISLELYRFMHRAYSNLIDHCPPVFNDLMPILNGYLYEDLRATLNEFLTPDDAHDLAAFLTEILADRPEILE